MNYPLISEYIESIKDAEYNFEKLSNLRPVLDNEGLPIMSSGNFAVVFKMTDEQTGKFHAVKCFLKDQEGRAEAYRMISDELGHVNSSFLTPIKYLDKELFVDTGNSEETEFPVLLMDWIDGDTLDKYVINNKYDGYKLSCLVYCFYELSMWLLSQPFAHGDLKPDNIIVKNDGNLVLIDYDGMFVPEMFGQEPREQGSPNYRICRDNKHGRLTILNPFSKRIDDLAIIHILLSLRVYSIYPYLIREHKEFAVFNEADFQNLQGAHTYQEILSLNIDVHTSVLFLLFQKTISNGFLNHNDWKLIHFENPRNDLPNMEMQMCSLDNIILAVELAYSSMQFKDPARNEFCIRDYSEKYNRIILATEIQDNLKSHEWKPSFNGIKYSRFKSNGIEKREEVVYDLRTYALRYLKFPTLRNSQ